MSELMKKEALRYIYKEMTMEENELFEKTLENNPVLMKICAECKMLLDQLNPEAFSPSQETIDRILAYSKTGSSPTS